MSLPPRAYARMKCTGVKGSHRGLGFGVGGKRPETARKMLVWALPRAA